VAITIAWAAMSRVTKEGPRQIHPHHAVPGRFGDVRAGLVRGDPRVVDEDPDGSEFLSS
jgi:hypothetical protein